MRAIWKFPLPVDDSVDVMMPAGARVLHLELQDGPMCLWALVDTEAPIVARTFHVIGTGNPAEHVTELPYIGSVQQPFVREVVFVWHVFDGGEAA